MTPRLLICMEILECCPQHPRSAKFGVHTHKQERVQTRGKLAFPQVVCERVAPGIILEDGQGRDWEEVKQQSEEYRKCRSWMGTGWVERGRGASSRKEGCELKSHTVETMLLKTGNVSDAPVQEATADFHYWEGGEEQDGKDIMRKRKAQKDGAWQGCGVCRISGTSQWPSFMPNWKFNAGHPLVTFDLRDKWL